MERQSQLEAVRSIKRRGPFHIDTEKSKEIWNYQELCRQMVLGMNNYVKKLSEDLQDIWNTFSPEGRLWASSDLLNRLLDVRHRAYNLRGAQLINDFSVKKQFKLPESVQKCSLQQIHYLDSVKFLQVPIGVEILQILLKREKLLREEEQMTVGINHLSNVCSRNGGVDDSFMEVFDYYPDFMRISGGYQDYIFQVTGQLEEARGVVEGIRSNSHIFNSSEVEPIRSAADRIEFYNKGNDPAKSVENFCSELSAVVTQVMVNVMLRARKNIANEDRLTDQEIADYHQDCTRAISNVQNGIMKVVLELLAQNIQIEQEAWALNDIKSNLVQQVVKILQENEDDEASDVDPLTSILYDLEITPDMRFLIMDIDILDEMEFSLDELHRLIEDVIDKLGSSYDGFQFRIVDIRDEGIQIEFQDLDASHSCILALDLQAVLTNKLRSRVLVGVTPLIISEYECLDQLFSNYPGLNVNAFWKEIVSPNLSKEIFNNHQNGIELENGGVTYRGKRYAREDIPFTHLKLSRLNISNMEFFPSDMQFDTIEFENPTDFHVTVELFSDQTEEEDTGELDSMEEDWMSTLFIDDLEQLSQPLMSRSGSSLLAERVDRYVDDGEMFSHDSDEFHSPRLKIVR